MRKIEKLIVHCSATKPDMNIGADEIREWHLKRGFSDIGYHFVIRRDGTLERGRPLDLTGAHCKGYNKRSVGICLIGGVDYDNEPQINYTAKQWSLLAQLISSFLLIYPDLRVAGHNEFSTKACPCFDVPEWYYSKN